MFVAKLDLKKKIIVVYGGDLCVCEPVSAQFDQLINEA